MSSNTRPATPERFTKRDRGDSDPVWTHNDKLVWVVWYDAIEGADYVRPEHWSVYYAIVPRKKGAEHWAHDNKRLGDFRTFDAALTAGDAYEPA